MLPTISDFFPVPAQSRIVKVEVPAELGNELAGRDFTREGE
jgi:hypothetical protein